MQRLFFYSLTLFLLGALYASADSTPLARTEIRLMKEYVVPDARTQQVTLGELAQSIDCPDPELAQQLAQTVILDAPQPGEQVRLGKHQVLFKIRTAGFDYHRINLSGENIIPVYGAGHRVAIAQMVSAIRARILQDSGWSEGELMMQVISTPSSDAWLPSRAYEMMIQRSGPMLHGTNRYEVQFFVDHVLEETAAFLVTVQRQRKVYVPVRDLQRGEVITPADLEEREMLVDNEARDRQLLENPQEIYGHRARTTIRRNDPIKTFSVETNYILQRGDLVQVLVREKGMTLQTTGQAQSRGAVGEVIPIKATATGKLVRGKVLSRNLVELVTS